MFLDLDVVEFNDSSIPYTSVLLNISMVRQIQRITTRSQERYTRSREQAMVEKEDNPEVFVSDVTELPMHGAEIILLSPQLGIYYTVTPYEDVRRQALELTRRYKENEAE